MDKDPSTAGDVALRPRTTQKFLPDPLTLASLPIIVLLLPVPNAKAAPDPITTLSTPDVITPPAADPNAVLFPPVEDAKALCPKADELLEVVDVVSAPSPNAQF
jgi:hypothetical protein